LQNAGRDRSPLGAALPRRREGTLRLLTDRFGLSWPIVPRDVSRWMTVEPEGTGRVMKAVLKMDRHVIEELASAYAH
jgi:predicted 3-demethylubiquinone-9 3-methyltransferase (glyoxalase superfamily)